MLKDKFKIKIETLPVTKDFLREKRYVEERGELVLLADGDEIRHITFFTLNPGKDFFRGGHFHKKKTEKFYVVSGKLNILIVDVDTKEKDIIEIIAGQRVTIYPFCAHKFQAVTESHVIEYYDSAYDIDDDVRFTDF
jgi:dTDP-4-dehydrorhamnose 3,5-epimerase-like enzyme